MKSRLGGRSSRATVLPEAPRLTSRATGQIILGIDPSLRGTGYGVIKMAKPFPETLAQGTISCPATWPHSRCLAKISQTLRDVLREHQPTVCAIEGLFFAQKPEDRHRHG
ncbi:MAG: crossover junction endodeoxyribonuclease RuvC [Limisphaerales bacterium]